MGEEVSVITPIAPFADIFSVPATYTPKGGDPIVTTWIKIDTLMPVDERVRTAFLIGAGEVGERRPIFALRRDQVTAKPPLDSRIVAAEIDGAPIRSWAIDDVDEMDPQFWRVEVHPVN